MKIKKLISVLFCIYSILTLAQNPTNNPKLQKVLLPNGWSLTPVGRALPLGDLPLNMQISKSNRLLAVTNNGQSTQSIQLIDPKTERIVDEKPIATSWYGLQFSQDEKKLYVSGGNDNIILVYPIKNQKLGIADTISLGKKWPNKISPTGIAIDDDAKILYTVTKENNSLYSVNLKNKKIIQQLDLGAEAYSCLLSPDLKTLYITLWGGDKVVVFDTKKRIFTHEIKTESHPNELITNKKGTILYVANANDNSVSIINTRSMKVVETISTALYPTKLSGSTTNGLALSKDEKTLFIANADNNCLAVFDVSQIGKSQSKGFIPTGWYPTNVKIWNSKILVTNGKGFSSLPNPEGPQPIGKKDDSGYQKSPTKDKDHQYIGGLFKGTLSIIAIPNENQLMNYSKMVYSNMPLESNQKIIKAVENNPIPSKPGEVSPIKYVFYIIKENRTYDQVLGDIKKGNGDSSLCLFPEKVTPNIHALVNEFVLLDNFYVDAEVSADGHNWSTAAYATDYVEKTWPISYGSRGGNYDYEGSRKIAYPRDGFIWDYCKRAGVSYRTYGEFSDGESAGIPALENHFCPNYAGFDMKVKDISRFEVWKKDFEQLMAKNEIPKLSTLRFSSDHTSGQKIGAFSPTAAVADNDLAVGMFVDYISHSPIWKETAIFILEDDAQNGPDHIDAHRSPVLVISPFTKRGETINKMYSTSGVLRTIELILGLPPMSQYDKAAIPLYECFTNTLNLSPYTFLKSNIDLEERNVVFNSSAKKSEKFNFAKEDSVPDLELNEVVWKSIKGEDSEMPAPRRSAFVVLEKKNVKSDD